MRSIAAATALVFGLAAAHPALARAGKCYVDSDCPTGMVCNSGGGCEVPSGGGGGTSSGHRSPAVLALYVVILGVVIVAILVPAMRATDQAGGAHARFDDLDLRHVARDPAPQTCNLTLHF